MNLSRQWLRALLCLTALGLHVGPNWKPARGGRDGVMGDHSPERLDPEWLSVWSKQPVAFYATVAQMDLQGGNQPAFISALVPDLASEQQSTRSGNLRARDRSPLAETSMAPVAGRKRGET